MRRDGVSVNLASALAVSSDLSLVVTELHSARSAFPSRSLTRDLFVQVLMALAMSEKPRSYEMQKLKALCLVSSFTASLAGCASVNPPPRPLPPAPYSYLSLVACRHYGSAFVDCQMEYATAFGRHRLGSVQQRERGYVVGNDHRYQVAFCSPALRVHKQLPNYLCQIYGARSGADAGAVLVKGGTAVRLARIFGDLEQTRYRWKPDRWSRVRD